MQKPKKTKFFSPYAFFALVTALLAVILRFYKYTDRWGLAYDQAHDALLARFALLNFKLPLLGPFSSAGPFQTGGQWYWFIMAAMLPNMRHVLTPWIVLTLFSVLFCFVIARVGTEMKDRTFGLIVGLFAAVSAAGISQGLNLTNQAPQPFLSLLALWSALRFIQTRRGIYAFFLGLFPALGMTVHLQAVAMGILIGVTYLFAFPWRPKAMVYTIIGFILPFLPLAYHDAHHGFANIRSMVTYMFFNPNQISYEALGRRWLTYISVFWPTEWANIIGGRVSVVYIILLSLFVIVVVKLFTRRLTKKFLFLLVSFFLMAALLRYVRTPIYASYLMFLHPFVLLLSAWAAYECLRWQRVLGVLFIAVVVVMSILVNIENIIHAENFTDKLTRTWKEAMIAKYPGKKFAVYDYGLHRGSLTLPLALSLDVDNLLDPNGVKIGMNIYTHPSQVRQPVVYGELGGYQLLDVTSSSSALMTKAGWVSVTPELMYRTTQEWQK